MKRLKKKKKIRKRAKNSFLGAWWWTCGEGQIIMDTVDRVLEANTQRRIKAIGFMSTFNLFFN